MERKLLFVRVEYIFGRELDYIRLDERMKGRGRKKNGWKNYKEFGNGDGEGIVSGAVVVVLLFFSLPFPFPFRFSQEREREREKICEAATWRKEKPFHETVTFHVYLNNSITALFVCFLQYPPRTHRVMAVMASCKALVPSSFIKIN